MNQPQQAGDLGWLLDDLVQRVDEVRQAVLLSRDGLVMGASSGVTRRDAEFLAALSSGFHSLANGAREHFAAKRVRQTVVEMDGLLFFIVPAGNGSCLAVLSEAGNAGMVAYETAMLIKRVRRHMTAAPRAEAEQQAAEPVTRAHPAPGPR
ncbi:MULTISPECIES: roadblock/LC7 domain-containing protein [Thermomonospora]|jgi:predicted regulator of Ras-like GTPase activity (Roadblock/LC7/MglB family)|uniref:Roadblock/LC7 family protein n=1 Tax=Thermomonospora curvata (strain ATCC 19995 / DSM 43183 / JCM 3096 / KCTC 9072 / NBRC 15933 / NCIMB 10081 / Henssen B9) TaxID=471852 RepID=D1A6U6_THECD|nr:MULTISPECIES: roadblock/LC7 domain-containing protein [Thermomonospora]ACY98350.1 Roadblock/LC7 family protein [Thermomonospora curvata DSM 43183]PKK13513.1 MAG: dynein regulation protein LC7 [Thermomonospora sp. CIF 1]